MEKKKILLLGGSAQQVIAIEKAKELGFYTVLCDYLPDNPGQYVADKYYNVSTTDIEAVYNVAKKENVKGILPYASDPAALPAAIVCERLGLPTNPVKSVEILGLKYTWRSFLSSHGYACPKTVSFSPDILLEDFIGLTKDFTFPIVIKPTDSSGSKGVTVLENMELLEDAVKLADSYSKNKILLAEEYINRGFPHVIGGDIFVWDGKIVLYGEMTCLRDYVNSPLIPIGEKKPSGLNSFQTDKIHGELQKIINDLDIKFGELNIEIILDKNNDVHFLEIGPRAGGNMIPVQLSDAFGIDLIKANIQVAMGIEPSFIKDIINENKGCYMHYVLHSFQNGIFQRLFIDKSIEQFIYRKVLYKKEGDIVEKFDGASKAVGIIFLHFNNENIMNDFCSRLENLVKVELK